MAGFLEDPVGLGVPVRHQLDVPVVVFDFVDVLRWSDGNPSHRCHKDKPDYPAPEHRAILCEAAERHN